MITPEQWESHWYRIREDYTNIGYDERVTGDLADVDTAEQFGLRPTQEGQ